MLLKSNTNLPFGCLDQAWIEKRTCQPTDRMAVVSVEATNAVGEMTRRVSPSGEGPDHRGSPSGRKTNEISPEESAITVIISPKRDAVQLMPQQAKVTRIGAASAATNCKVRNQYTKSLQPIWSAESVKKAESVNKMKLLLDGDTKVDSDLPSHHVPQWIK